MASDFKEEVALKPKVKAKVKAQNGKRRVKRPVSQVTEDLALEWDRILPQSARSFWDAVHEVEVQELHDNRIFVTLTDHKNPESARKFFVAKSECPDSISIGDRLSVYVADKPENSDEPIQVSAADAILLQQFMLLNQAFKEKEMLSGEILAKVKGGYNVELWLVQKDGAVDRGTMAIRAFLPATLAHIDRKNSTGVEYNKPLWFTVKELDAEAGSVVVSLKRFLRKEQARLESEFFDNMKVGDKVSGVIKNIVAYGAFVDIGGVDAFLHVSDYSWDRHVDSRYFKVGQKVQAQVIEILREEKKVKISVKALSEDPWQQALRDFASGIDVEGVIVSIADFGAFIQLREGIEGLVHVSEISWGRIKHPSTKLHIGDVVKARVIDLDPKNRKISLSIKALQPNPLEQFVRNTPKEQLVEARILEVGPFGIVVHLEDGVIGFVPKNEISWHEVSRSSYHEGQSVKVVLMNDALDRNRIMCSIKRTSEDPWLEWNKKFKAGSKHDLTVTKVSDAGVEFEPEPGLHAWCPKSELEEDADRRPSEFIKVGQVLSCQVLRRDARSERILVSPKAAMRSDTDKAYQEYLQKQQQESGSGSALAEALSRHRN